MMPGADTKGASGPECKTLVATPAHDAVPTRALWVCAQTIAVPSRDLVCVVVVPAPLLDIAVHIHQTPGVRWCFANVNLHNVGVGVGTPRLRIPALALIFVKLFG